MARLPAGGGTVKVGPPLSARVPRPALTMPTWLLLTPLVRPPLPPAPIRLKALARSTLPAISSGVVLGAGPRKLPATMVLKIRAAVPWSQMPPPKVLPAPAVARVAGVGEVGMRADAQG